MKNKMKRYKTIPEDTDGQNPNLAGDKWKYQEEFDEDKERARKKAQSQRDFIRRLTSGESS